MRFNFLFALLLILNGCKAQSVSNEIIDPISKLPFEIILNNNNIKFSEIDSSVSSGLLDIMLEIDSIGNIKSYRVQVVKINFLDKESFLFVNGNPLITNDKIEIIHKHLIQIDDFIKNNVTVKKRFSAKTNENYMKIPIKVR